MDPAVVECWNAERRRRHASGQHVQKITEAEWDRFHEHNKQRKYCTELMKRRNAGREDKAWATQEVQRHSG